MCHAQGVALERPAQLGRKAVQQSVDSAKPKFVRVAVVAAVAAILIGAYDPGFFWKARQQALLACWLTFHSKLYVNSNAFLDLQERVVRTVAAVEWYAPDRPTVLPNVHEIDVKDFDAAQMNAITNGFREPIIIRGLLNTAGSRTWGDEDFIAKYGDTSMIINNATSTNLRSNVHDKFYSLEETTLDKLDASIQTGGAVVSYGLDELFQTYPELANEVGVERYGRGGHKQACRQLGMLYGKANAGQRGGLMWHNAISSNFLAQTSGYKRVSLIHNTYSMYFFPTSGSQYDSGFLSSGEWDFIDHIPRTYVDMRPGDVILFPPWLWHATETIPATEGFARVPEGQVERQANINLGVTCRFSAPVAAFRNDAQLSFFRQFGSKYGQSSDGAALLRYVPYYSQVMEYVREVTGTMPAWDDLDDCWASKRTACRRKNVNE